MMTLKDLKATVDRVLYELALGNGSVRRSSAYHDYVALEFACFPDTNVVLTIRSAFERLCVEHDWHVCSVSSRGNSVCVTMHERELISTGERRMPSGLETAGGHAPGGYVVDEG